MEQAPQPDAADAPGEPLLGTLFRSTGLLLWVTAVLLRLFSSGGGVELYQPETQLFFDGIALCACFATLLARAAARETPFASGGRALIATAILLPLLALGAWRMPHPDLAWRTASTWTALLLLGLTARELGRDRRVARQLAAFLVGCVIVGAGLGLYQYASEFPALIAEYERGGLSSELDVLDPSFQMGLRERIYARAAIGPYLLPNLLACAVCAVLPLAWAMVSGRGRRLGNTQILAGGVFVLLVVALACTKSKGGAVTLGGVGAMLALLHPRLRAQRRRLGLLVGTIGALGLLLGGIVFVAGPERVGIGLSFTVRLEYWEAALAMLREEPLLGVGLNGFREFYAAMKPPQAEETLHAHNLLLQVAAELGLVGLLAFAGLLAAWIADGLPALAAAEDSLTEETAAEGKTAPEGLPRHLSWATLGGGLLGLVVLAGFGDCYNASYPPALGSILLGLPVVTWLGRRALEAAPPAVCGAAALAGASALLWDGLLDFGLHHAGVMTLAWNLAALAPALAGRTPAPASRALRWLMALGVAAGVLAAGAGAVAGGLDAHPFRDQARRDQLKGVQAARAANSGQRGTQLQVLDAQKHLGNAATGFAGAVTCYPWNARTWLEYAGTLEGLSRLVPRLRVLDPTRNEPGAELQLQQAAIAAGERAATLAPRSAETWNELGQVRSRRLSLRDYRPDLEGALEAFDRAVALYPAHPEYRLDAGRVRVRLLSRVPPHEPRAATLRAEARAHLLAAREASERTRLRLRKLRPEQLHHLERLLEGL